MCLYIAIDFILTSITFDVSGLLNALQNDFNNLQQDDKGTEDDYSRLKENVINHQKLLRYFSSYPFQQYPSPLHQCLPKITYSIKIKHFSVRIVVSTCCYK